MRAQSSLYRRRIKPQRQSTIPEDGRPSHVYAHSAINVPVTTRDVPNPPRSFSTPNVSISSSINSVVPHSTDQQPPQSSTDPSYTTRTDEPKIANRFLQTGPSLEAPVSENLISNYPQATHTNGASNSSDGYALPLNSQYFSHPSSQQWYTSLNQYRPSQGTENARNADNSSVDSMPCSNTLHTLENETPQVSPENYSSVLDQRRVAAWNNGEYSGPLAKSYWSFPDSSHQHIDADSVSPRSSRCEMGLSEVAREGCEDSNGNTFSRSNHESHFAHGGESSYKTGYGTNPARSDGYDSAGIHRPLQSSAKQLQDFNIRNGFSALQVDEDGENPQYMTGSKRMGNQEPSGASRTTTYTESTLSTDSASSSSVSDDDGTSRQRLPSQSGQDLNTGINLQRSYQRYKRQKLSNEVGCEFSSFLAQRLIGEIGKCVPMRCTRVAKWPTTQS
jgi:hypothetical protein